jgi:SAM-dependent methyltransferase
MTLFQCPVCHSELTPPRCPNGHEFQVVDGIPILLAEGSDSVSKEIAAFYEENWKEGKAKKLHEDVSDLGQRYIQDNEKRAVEVREGTYFLDVGCGAQPRVEFGAKHQFHICMDMTLAGIVEARKRLGDRGIYVVGSILNSPIRQGVIDNALAAHCIYHIQAERQNEAVRNIVDTLKPGGKLTVLYSNPNSLEKKLVGVIPHKKKGEIYFQPIPLKKLTAGLNASIRGLRLFSQTISRPLFKFFGGAAFKALTGIERRFSLPSASTYVVIEVKK